MSILGCALDKIKECEDRIAELEREKNDNVKGQTLS